MKGNSLSIGNRLVIGFCAMLVLVGVIIFLSCTGIRNIVGNAEGVIRGNMLVKEIAQREVDLLNWASQVNSLFTDEGATCLEVETDEHKGGFGLWLYGRKREDAVKLAPSLAPLFKEIEKSHAQMHASAREIVKLVLQADIQPGNFLSQTKADHLAWIQSIKDAFRNDAKSNLENVQTDPAQCNLGKWMYSDSTTELRRANPEFAELFNKLEYHHTRLHNSVADIQKFINSGDRLGAKGYFTRTTEPIARQVAGQIDKILSWNDARATALDTAHEIYTHETLPAIKRVHAGLSRMQNLAQKDLPSDGAMITAANQTRRNVIIMGIAAMVLGLFLSIIMAKSITGPIIQLANTFRRVAEEKDLTLEVPVKSGDEVGTMTTALNKLLQFLEETFQQIKQTADSVATNTGELFERASKNKERAEKKHEELNKSVEIISQMKETAGEISRSSLAHKDTAMKTNMTIGRMLTLMDEVSASMAAQTNEAQTTALKLQEMGETGGKVAGTAAAQDKMVMEVSIAVNNMAAAVEAMSNAVNQASDLLRYLPFQI